MTPVMDQPSIFLTQFPEFARARTAPKWIQDLRERALLRFAERGFPTTHEEDWRFTNVGPIGRTAYKAAPPARVKAEELPARLFDDASCARLVFVNGRFAADLSDPRGLGGSLAAALERTPDLVEPHLATAADFLNQGFVALNTAYLDDGAFVHVPKGVVAETPIHIVFVSVPGEDPMVTHPRVLVVAERDSQVTLVESYLGLGDSEYFTNAVSEFVTGENAVVDHYKLELEGPRAYHVATLQAEQGRGANFTSHLISLGGALVRNDAASTLSEGCECTLNGFYLASGTQHIDNHTAIDHAKPHGTSHELFKGILDGHSSAVFNGKILVRKDAQKTDAKQTNKNLVLSEDAVINTKPELQIFADDVRCTHGATVGQLDAEAVFYLQSRGIGRQQAIDLLTYAFARDVIERVKVAPLRDRLEKLLFEKLHDHRR